ncbi:putative translation initiation factor [Wallemia mellicola]|uniref:Translation initiation factor n=1 Tax=Wallemia mellicola TaxID=1708541 RepID=A0AB74KDT9_9BASI|nr:hypothetical protein E3Q24_01528 [Wallemia mellicola]TIB84744.1 putative translation initiation factor [Wallemia mellicola]TIB87971.1 putative translation initiation factor [Wallemia mellicola]TIC23156.1 putative translation initiation factor [Wallemia mellicola]TIC41642.1 putative translation initiation factor [Wallemia mellicola]
MKFTSISFEDFSIKIIDQLKLPHELVWMDITSVEEAYSAIRNMNIRGAPALASLATLSVAQRLHNSSYNNSQELKKEVKQVCDYLYQSRPTAVNLGIALDQLRQAAEIDSDSVDNIKKAVIYQAILVWSEDVERNKQMSDNGAQWLIDNLESSGKIKKGGKISILTVCNTGSLATSGYGTAFGMITRLHELGRLERAYYAQTTPYHQGTRLTAFEFTQLGIPSCLVCDTAVGSLISSGIVQAVTVGADRIALNGDTANKIGTMQSAMFAKTFNIPFTVVAPRASVDSNLNDGRSIPIELRAASEAVTVRGIELDSGKQTSVRIAPKEVGATGLHTVYNPGFDITPSQLISAVVLETGVAENKNGSIDVKSLL